MPDRYLAIADEQLEAATSTLLKHGYRNFHNDKTHYDETATEEHASGWPGHIISFRNLISTRDQRIYLTPASFWYLDLGPASFSVNTFLLPGTRCRFPTKLFRQHIIVGNLFSNKAHI